MLLENLQRIKFILEIPNHKLEGSIYCYKQHSIFIKYNICYFWKVIKLSMYISSRSYF